MPGRGYYGPPWFGAYEYEGEGRRNSPTIADIMAAEEWTEYLKEKIKRKEDEEKKKTRKRPEAKGFTFLETLSVLMLFSLPIAIGQLALLNHIRDVYIH